MLASAGHPRRIPASSTPSCTVQCEAHLRSYALTVSRCAASRTRYSSSTPTTCPESATGSWQHGHDSAEDVAHLVFAPYVDLFFGDDETVKNVRQERRSKKGGHLLAQHLPARIRWAPAPEAIIAEIQEVARERTTRVGDPASPS